MAPCLPPFPLAAEQAPLQFASELGAGGRVGVCQTALRWRWVQNGSAVLGWREASQALGSHGVCPGFNRKAQKRRWWHQVGEKEAGSHHAAPQAPQACAREQVPAAAPTSAAPTSPAAAHRLQRPQRNQADAAQQGETCFQGGFSPPPGLSSTAPVVFMGLSPLPPALDSARHPRLRLSSPRPGGGGLSAGHVPSGRQENPLCPSPSPRDWFDCLCSASRPLTKEAAGRGTSPPTKTGRLPPQPSGSTCLRTEVRKQGTATLRGLAWRQALLLLAAAVTPGSAWSRLPSTKAGPTAPVCSSACFLPPALRWLGGEAATAPCVYRGSLQLNRALGAIGRQFCPESHPGRCASLGHWGAEATVKVHPLERGCPGAPCHSCHSCEWKWSRLPSSASVCRVLLSLVFSNTRAFLFATPIFPTFNFLLNSQCSSNYNE